jgi:hypothetical protein
MASLMGSDPMNLILSPVSIRVPVSFPREERTDRAESSEGSTTPALSLSAGALGVLMTVALALRLGEIPKGRPSQTETNDGKDQKGLFHGVICYFPPYIKAHQGRGLGRP